MKRKWQGPSDQPELPGARTYLADAVAEALMMHKHSCVARRAAEAYLVTLGVTEVQYLLNWAAGAYDG